MDEGNTRAGNRAIPFREWFGIAAQAQTKRRKRMAMAGFFGLDDSPDFKSQRAVCSTLHDLFKRFEFSVYYVLFGNLMTLIYLIMAKMRSGNL